MSIMKSFDALLGLHSESSPEFARARFASLAQQLPILYLGVIINTFAIIATFANTAPAWLLLSTAPFAAFAFNRIVYWLKTDPDAVSDAKIAIELHRVTVVASVVGFIYAVWMTALFPFADTIQLIFLSLFVFVWTVNAAYTLATVPLGAVLLVSAISVPLIAMMLMETTLTFSIAAMQFTFTGFLTFHMIRKNYNHLAFLTAARRELDEKRRQAEAFSRHISDLAYRDPLTGLANRRSFEEHLRQLAGERAEKSDPFAVVIVDLDGFKPVNDVYGHRAGDAVLKEVAGRLTSCLGEGALIARLGGDEFGILLPDAIDAGEATITGERLCTALRSPFQLDGRQARLSGSCGIALFPDAGHGPDTLMIHADSALFASKSSARGEVTVYSISIEKRLRDRARIEQALRRAIAEDTIDLYFQPIFRLSTLDVLGFEALARWRDEDLGRVSPTVFIPIAEEAGLIGDLTALLLKKAAAYAAVWPPHVLLSFNVSAAEIVRPTTGLHILSALARQNLAPSRLEIEITETALLTDYKSACANIEQLRDAGVRIALDDFGTGHSSFSHLQHIGIDRLKIDKSFTSTLIRDRRSQAIVKAIADLCNGLGIECLAEGIENQHQIATLKSYGVRLGQGFLLGAPMSADDALVFLGAHFADMPGVAALSTGAA